MDIERKIELEDIISIQGNNNLSLLNYNLDDANYILTAIYLPYYEILDIINEYDKKPMFIKDDFSFLVDLANKYNVSRRIIINRIKDIKKIEKYKNKCKKMVFKYK